MLLGLTTLGLRGVSIASTVFLARLLDPSDFGIVALALVLLSTSNLFSGLGMRHALIQTRIERNLAAYHAVLITFLAGFCFTSVVFIFADVFADILGNIQTAPLIKVLSVVILMQSLSLVPEALLQKDLLFAKVSSSMLFPELIYLGIAVALASLGFGLWSLVYAGVARAFSRMVLLFSICPERGWLKPRPIDPAVITSLVRFGIQSTGSGFVSFANSVMDNMFVGRVMGVQALGYYSKAYDFSTNTVDGFNKVLGGVLFPSYSKIQEDRERLSSAYMKSLRLVSLVIIPASVGIFSISPELISVLLGAKWQPMVTSLQILSLMCLVRSLSATTSPLFLSMGFPNYDLRAGLLVMAAALTGMFSLQFMGIAGVAIAFLVAHILGFVYNVYQVGTLLPDSTRRMLSSIVPALLGSLLMGVTIFLCKAGIGDAVQGLNGIAWLLVLVLAGLVVYGSVIFLSQRELIYEVKGLIRSAVAVKTSTVKE